ncbi:MAG: pyridoxamine 5'-phosphate oxidase [Chloroflexi bacterium HGW-Chloroflexi-6]|nr:MAG: pyridoxamine 5'-phosphate oxidase [Chloroflexi bacterium HGW-Chloroflexi-6]
MEAQLASQLAQLIRSTRQASLATLHNGAPFVSMALVAPSPDLSTYYLHISRLAQHTHDIEADPRVSIMFMEKDDGSADPQQLSRISLMGRAFKVGSGDLDYPQASTAYLKRFPASASYFTFSDFYLFRVRAESGRFVAGFAKAMDLNTDDLKQASQT